MPNQWLNNAAQNFDVIRSYGEANFQKLKSVPDKYDAGKTSQGSASGDIRVVSDGPDRTPRKLLSVNGPRLLSPFLHV